jgi:hypothetical protein
VALTQPYTPPGFHQTRSQFPDRASKDSVSPGPTYPRIAAVASGAARTRSIEWKADAPTCDAVAFLRDRLDHDTVGRFALKLQPGMGLVGHNVLHARTAFVDDPAQPRLLYRARYLDRIRA